MNTDDDFWGITEAINSKATPGAIGSWISMVNKTEGRDKLLKIVQFGARFFKWQSSKADAAIWNNLYLSVQEGRKSVRVLKGINKVDQIFDEVPKADSLFEKSLIFGNWMCMALFWHWDYILYAHKIKFVKLDEPIFKRMSQLPGLFRILHLKPN